MLSMMGGAPSRTAGLSMCAQYVEASIGSRCAGPAGWSGRGHQTGVHRTQPIEKCWGQFIEDSDSGS